MPRQQPHRPLALSASHWRMDGRPKVRYDTRNAALTAARERREEAGVELGVYRCDFCAGWHIGALEARRADRER